MKTSNLIGRALDWAVAEAQGKAKEWMHDHKIGYINSASTDWAQGGPIIEREKINLCFDNPPQASIDYMSGEWIEGPTSLIAAMRCYVTSKLGDTIDIPEELK
jgi:hypothetical protein